MDSTADGLSVKLGGGQLPWHWHGPDGRRCWRGPQQPREATNGRPRGAMSHAHLVAVLEVAEVLLPEPRVLPDAGDAMRVLEGTTDIAQRLQHAAVWGDIEIYLSVIGCLVRIGGEEVTEVVAAVLSILMIAHMWWMAGDILPSMREGRVFWLASFL
jgi:hypothetical protein